MNIEERLYLYNILHDVLFTPIYIIRKVEEMQILTSSIFPGNNEENIYREIETFDSVSVRPCIFLAF